jgi:hypothetical protein
MTGTYSVVLAILFASSPASAQTDTEKIRARVKHGQKVSITDDQGQEIKGRISTMTADGLTILVDGQSADVPYDRIVRIDRPNDILKNGALIGFGVGAALGVLAMASYSEPEGCQAVRAWGCGEPSAGGMFAGTLLLGGLGTAVGVGIDALIRRDSKIYQRGGAHATLSPVLASGVRAARASLRW